MTTNLDLFGDPIPENWGRRGRPSHIATQQNCNKVNLLVAFGWSNDRIAKALGITPPTLRKNYFRQLKFRDEQRDRLDAAMAMRLWNDFQAGNVAAAKLFLKLLERNDLMLYGQTARPQTEEPKEEKLGKKAKALLDAQAPDCGTTLGELMARRQAPELN